MGFGEEIGITAIPIHTLSGDLFSYCRYIYTTSRTLPERQKIEL